MVVDCPRRTKWCGKHFDVIFGGRVGLSFHMVVTRVRFLRCNERTLWESRFEVLMTMFTIFLLRGWPPGFDLCWDVSSSFAETVVVVSGTRRTVGRSRVTVIDKESDLVLIHHPTGMDGWVFVRGKNQKKKNTHPPLGDVHLELGIIFVPQMVMSYDCPGCGRRNPTLGRHRPLSNGCDRCATRIVEDAILQGHSVTFHILNKPMTAL